MRIAQVAPLIESVPPRMYGGTERIVSYLTEELVKQGHSVTLFASGDSFTRARLIPGTPRALRLDEGCKDHIVHHILMFEKLQQMADEFDIIHNHTDYLPFSILRRVSTPSLTTLHGRLDLPDLVQLYQEFTDIPLVSISNDQRRPLAGVNWMATVYHGLPLDLYNLQETPGDYLGFLGRVSPEKGVDSAVAIAQMVGLPLKIAAKVDRQDLDYFNTRIRPLLGKPGVEFIGEIKDSEKNDFIGKAKVMLFPIDWPEPFGLAMIEAMACGTPSVAFRRGAVPEVASEGISGFVVENVKEAAMAVEKAVDLDRARIRRLFEQRFSASHMTEGYLAAYRSLLAQGEKNSPSGEYLQQEINPPGDGARETCLTLLGSGGATACRKIE